VTAEVAAVPIRVMIVEDHALVRSAVRQAISGDRIEVVAEASTAEAALVLALEARPDIMLVDIDLPGMSGLHLVRELGPQLPATKIVMLTVSSARRDLIDAVKLGAMGYLTKDLSPEALVRSIRGAMAGEMPMPRRMAAEVIAHLRTTSAAPVVEGGLARLTSREIEVLRLIAEGLTDRQVATALQLSIRTVETHTSNLLHKLGARNRAEAARIYREEE
jgi:two-component system nitrate/nitrite response regulator NarL